MLIFTAYERMRLKNHSMDYKEHQNIYIYLELFGDLCPDISYKLEQKNAIYSENFLQFHHSKDDGFVHTTQKKENKSTNLVWYGRK